MGRDGLKCVEWNHQTRFALEIRFWNLCFLSLLYNFSLKFKGHNFDKTLKFVATGYTICNSHLHF